MSGNSSFGTSHITNFEVSDFLEFRDWIEHDSVLDPAFSEFLTDYSNPHFVDYNTPNYEVVVDSSGISSNQSSPEGPIVNENGGKDNKEKIAFRTKSEIEILDDGFKWRKYGKKMVKNSPNPRNYYRCSVERCPVKKRVERDNEDQRYVVTTYEGVHNHQSCQNSIFR